MQGTGFSLWHLPCLRWYIKSKLHHFLGQVLNLEHLTVSSGDAQLLFKTTSVFAQTKSTGAQTK